MDKATRNAIERATQQARKLLDEDFSSQLEGTFDVLRSGVIASKGGAHLSELQQSQRDKIVAAIEHKRAAGMTAAEAVTDYVRDAAFTTLNRFVALKMLEARELVQECITKGEQSAGYREFCGMAPGVALLPDAAGYRLYIESLFDEFSTEIKVLFDRRDAASVLWPKRADIRRATGDPKRPRTCPRSGARTRRLAGSISSSIAAKSVRRCARRARRRATAASWPCATNSSRRAMSSSFSPTTRLAVCGWRCTAKQTRLNTICEYLVRSADEPVQSRPRKDPRDLRILDPACGSGHFLLYSFDLLLTIYEEAWSADGAAPRSEVTGRTLRDDYPDLVDLRRAVPRLSLRTTCTASTSTHAVHRLLLWPSGCGRSGRGKTSALPPPTGRAFIALTSWWLSRCPAMLHLLMNSPRGSIRRCCATSSRKWSTKAAWRVSSARSFEWKTVSPRSVHRAREQFVKQRQTTDFLPGMEPMVKQGALDLSGIDDDGFFHEAEARIVEALRGFAETAIGGASVRRRLFAGDAAQGVALIDLVRTRFDVVLMNPPFGAGSLAAKKEFDQGYPRTKNDVYAAFVERGIQLLHPHGLLGAITSRTGFFLSSFQKWREEILLKEAPPVVFADLGYGVLDSAMVEVAAYCLEKVREVAA